MVRLGWRYLGLWKNRFFGSWAILGCSQPLGRLIFCRSGTYAVRQKIFRKCGMKKIFWKILEKTSKLSRNIFWACWDHVVAQKSTFRKKSPKTSQTQGPPPRLATCVISSILRTIILPPPPSSDCHMMQSSIGRSDWFDWTSKCRIFFSTENNPNNVHIEKKLRLWRFWKFKNFSHFSAFLHPKRYLKVYMVFCKID